MRIAVVATFENVAAPANPIAPMLVDALSRAGHAVEFVELPFDVRYADESLAALRLVDVPSADRLIALCAASSVLPHPQVVAWLALSPERPVPESIRGQLEAVYTIDDFPIPSSDTEWQAAVERLVR